VKTIVLLLAFCSCARADIAFMSDGREITGSFAGISKGRLILREGGRRKRLPVNQIVKLKFTAQGRPAAKTAAAQAQPGFWPSAAAQAQAHGLGRENPAPAAGEDRAVLLWETVYELKPDMSSVRTERVAQKIFSASARDAAADGKVYYIDGYQSAKLDYACSYSGGAAACADETTVQDGSELADFAGYDYLRSVKFSMPRADAGAVTDYQAQVKTPEHYKSFPFAGSFQFGTDAPARLVRLKVITPQKVSLNSALVNDGGAVKFSQTAEGGRNIYVWEARNLPAVPREDDMPPDARALPCVMFAASDTWESVAAFLSSRIDRLLAGDSGLDSAAAGIASQPDAAGAAYGWVMRNIRYQPVEMDAAPGVPLPVSRIISRAAGNALDKPFALYALLRKAGVSASLAYMESRAGAPFSHDVPSIRQFAAVCVIADWNGKRSFLCPHDDWVKPGYIPQDFQGMKAFAVHGPLAGEFLDAPLMPPEAECEDIVSEVALSTSGALAARMVIRPSGGYEQSWRQWRGLRKEELDGEMAGLARQLHPKARLESYELSDLSDPDAPVRAALRFSVDGYAAVSSGGSYMALRAPAVSRPSGVSAARRKYPLDFGCADLQKYSVSLSLPPGYEIYSLPENMSASAAGAEYSASYQARGGTVLFSETALRRVPEISPGDYGAYRNLRLQQARFTSKWIALKKTGAAPAPAAPPRRPEPEPPRQPAGRMFPFN